MNEKERRARERQQNDEQIILAFLRDSEKNRIQLFTLIVAAFGVLYGIAFTVNVASDIFLLIPFIIIILGMRLKFYDDSVMKVANFKEEQDDKNKVPSPLRDYMKEHSSKIKILVFDVIPKWMLFIAIPMTIAIIYSCGIFFGITSINNVFKPTNIFPDYLYILFISFFLLIISFTGYFFIYKKQIKNKHLSKELCDKKERKRLFGW